MSKFDDQTAQSRKYFPRGLEQPDDSFRFSVDALLLGSFAATVRPSWKTLADLGCGCGVVAFAALLHCSGSEAGRFALGVDLHTELVSCANRNAERLGFSGNYCAVSGDLEHAHVCELTVGQDEECVMPPKGFDLVTSNPPYRNPEQGRKPGKPMRSSALFAPVAVLDAFIRSARDIVAADGALCLIFLYERRTELYGIIRRHGFYLEKTVPVCTKRGEKPRLILVCASLAANTRLGGEGPYALKSTLELDSVKCSGCCRFFTI